MLMRYSPAHLNLPGEVDTEIRAMKGSEVSGEVNNPAPSHVHSAVPSPKASSTIETEWLYHFTFDSRVQDRSYVFDYIEEFYNRTRMHSSFGYRLPIDYETVVSAASLRGFFFRGRQSAATAG
jgi:hypothetical protein